MPSIRPPSRSPRIEFLCKSCSGRISAAPDRLGALGKCPFCGEVVKAEAPGDTIHRRSAASQSRGAKKEELRKQQVVVGSPAARTGLGTDDSWRIRHERQRRAWERRRRWEERASRLMNSLSDGRATLVVFGILILVAVGLIAFGLSVNR